jgi:hypothetical protein
MLLLIDFYYVAPYRLIFLFMTFESIIVSYVDYSWYINIYFNIQMDTDATEPLMHW